MLTPKAGIDPEFFQCLRKHDPLDPQVSLAIIFSRITLDLCNRILTARSAARREIPQQLDGLQLAFFNEYAQHGAEAFASGASALSAAALDSEMATMLADTAHWLAGLLNLNALEDSSYQVWLSDDPQARISLYGKPAPVAPPDFIRLEKRHPALDWIEANAHRPAQVMGHYDVHGISMLALTRRFLTSHGMPQVDCTFNFESTGDISKLWKRVVPRAIASEEDYGTVVMVDCSVHSRRPEYTQKAISRLDSSEDSMMFLVDHHSDTLLQAPDLFHPRLRVVLTDILSCGLTDRWGRHELDLMYLGALGDKVPEVSVSRPPAEHPELYSANEQFHAWMINYSPTPKEMKDRHIQPLQKLWEALADGAAVSPDSSTKILGQSLDTAAEFEPECSPVGEILLMTTKLPSVGRTWYGLLEQLMQRHERSYALALRVLGDNRANLLLLTHWTAIHRAPVRMFIPERYQGNCIGHPGAVWVDLERQQATDFIRSTVDALNQFYGVEADIGKALSELQGNVLYPQEECRS
ncbi:MAG: hypothetical protein H7A35_13975 [Planctomycetales bacterium]|nr:hypothetical protein [bacterium]UNM07949.1 MAG: hypothetical protein H7A35_13975 [Planctomycetales bacterium]